jgi:hypothetical protein
MAYTFDQIFAADPSNPENVAGDATVTIFAPGDATMTPLAITAPDGSPLANPIPVNANGFASAFTHETLDRVAWSGGGFTGFFTSYEGLKNVAVDAQTAATDSAQQATLAAGAAAASAALAGAPADTAVAAVVNGEGSATRAALDARYADAVINRKSAEFDYTSVSPTFYDNLNLADTTVLQCFVINETTNEIYATQVANGNPDSTESYMLSRLTMGGKLIDSMRLNHGGHGTTIGLETIGTDVYIWSNYDIADATGKQTGNKLVRYKYVPGAIYNQNSPELVEYNRFTTEYVSAFTDQQAGLIAFRIKAGDVQTVQLRRISDVKAGIDSVLGTVLIPPGDAALDYFQGATIDGDDLYWNTGDNNGATYPHEITRFSFTTGEIISRITVDFGRNSDGVYEDGFREPESIYLYKDPVTGAKSLFAGVVTGESGRRNYKAYAFHSLGNEAKFLGTRMQKVQAHKLTENTGTTKRLPYGVTTLRSPAFTAGYYYMSTADSSTFTDHPAPGIAGWHMFVSPAEPGGARTVTLRRNTGAGSNVRVYETNVQGDGSFSPWQLVTTGSNTWTAIPLDPAAAVGWTTPQCTLVEGGTFVALQGSFVLSGAYTSGMTIGTLPVGFRPTATRRLAVAVDDGAGGRSQVNITSGGIIQLYGTVASTKKVLLDGIRFGV